MIGRSRGRVVGGVLALVLLAHAPVAAPPAVAASVEVPVAGSAAMYQYRRAETPFATLLVHELRRVPGGTVLYYSLGVPEGDERPTMVAYAQTNADLWGLPCKNRQGDGPGVHYLVDTRAKLAYTALCGDDDLQVALDGFGTARPPQFGVLWAAYPELPADTTAIDVVLSNGAVIRDVPVRDGVMTPVVQPEDGAVVLGTGWPEVDLDRIASAPDPSVSILPLVERTADLKDQVRTRTKARSTTVDLSSDVLFAVDSATLSKAALGRLKEVAAEINAEKAAGGIAIVGHTDSTGSSSHNDDLSRRRAQAVAKALKPLLADGGARLAVSGKGEDEPVADNTTDEGRRLNRRVSITFATPGDS